jgi:hypothetical protein
LLTSEILIFNKDKLFKYDVKISFPKIFTEVRNPMIRMVDTPTGYFLRIKSRYS